MSPPFSAEEILEEFAEAGASGHELFSASGGFLFLMDPSTKEELAKKAQLKREWRRYNQVDRGEEHRQRWEAIKASPVRLARKRTQNRESKRRKKPARSW